MVKTNEEILKDVKDKFAEKNKKIADLESNISELENKLAKAYADLENHQKLLDSLSDLLQEQ